MQAERQPPGHRQICRIWHDNAHKEWPHQSLSNRLGIGFCFGFLASSHFVLAWPMAIKGAIKRKFHKTATAASALQEKCFDFEMIRWMLNFSFFKFTLKTISISNTISQNLLSWIEMCDTFFLRAPTSASSLCPRDADGIAGELGVGKDQTAWKPSNRCS